MELTGRATVVGVVGDPIAHSLSPPMHNQAFRSLAMDWVYVPLHVKADHLGEAIAGIRALGMRGINVTVPHKVAVMNYLDDIDEEARRVGAVNTIVNDNGRLVGYNTDGLGFVRSLERQAGRRVEGARIVIIGAGGAAQGIAFALAGARAAGITVVNRTVQKAVEITKTVEQAFGVEVAAYSDDDRKFWDEIAKADIVVQATSIGMHPDHDVPPPPWVEALRQDALVADIVYNPRETALIQAARSRGCDVLTGEGMLVYQGAIAFELWTGVEAPDELMLATLQRLLNEVGT